MMFRVLLCILSLTSFIRAATPAQATDLTPVSVRFPIPIVESGQASFYLAEDRGYFEREGLQVKFSMGSKELNPIKMVAAGTDTFGVIGGPDTVLVARSNDAPVKAVAVLHRNSNFVCLLTLKESGITRVEQLEGKRVGMYYGHISTDILHTLFRKVGIHPKEVDVGFDYKQLAAGRIDAQWAFTVTAGLDLPAQGVPVNVISPADSGITTDGYTIFALEETIKTKPALVERFLRAALDGVRDAVADPKAATDALLKRDPSLDPALSLRRQQAYNAVTSASEKYPPGYMDREMFSAAYERLNALGVLGKAFPFEEAFTTEFLDKVRATPKDGVRN